MGFNNGPKLVTQGLDLLVDAADPSSYPGSGTVWTDLRSGTTGSLTGSVSYTSEYYGGLTFTDSSSAVIFPGSTANYGTGSFTVEMAFKPDYIEGRHYLMSKNSGSFPNWAIYLSGSSGQGRLWSEFNIDASVSCSYSSSTVFQTGSVYQVDVRILPGISSSGIYVNGVTENGASGNGGGSLETTASLFVGNYSQDSTQNFSGSIYTVKTYTVQSFTQPSLNFNARMTMYGYSTVSTVTPVFDLLVVAGGGGGGKGPGNNFAGGGGGAGGLQYLQNYNVPLGSSQIIVGAGGVGGTGGAVPGQSGNNSSFNTVVSTGGGGGGAGGTSTPGKNGGSGGGGGGYSSPTAAGTGVDGQGFAGGASDGNNGDSGGGGGGAFEQGYPGLGLSSSGSGGAGLSYNMTGELLEYSRGGNGGIGSQITTPRDPIANSGNGGDGNRSQAAGSGSSGIVAIRYSGGPIAIGGEITQSEGYTYHVFRTVGTSSFTIF